MRHPMKGLVVIAIVAVGFTRPATPVAQGADTHRHWHQWRGPLANGVATTANPPLEWSETRNVRWKTEIPGRGSSSPIVWGDRIYLTSAVPVGVTGDAQHSPRGGQAQRGVHRFVVLAIDRKTGKTVWERVAREAEPHEAAHFQNGTWASGSPITDGQTLFAYFESFGLYAYDLNGKLLWEKDLGDKRMRNQFGEGSTPALHGNTLVIVWDHLNGDGSFVTALDKRDGKELWRVPRDEIDTWATPLILEVNGRAQAIVPAQKRIRSYDLDTGRIVWEADGLTMNPIPSPVHENGLVILMSGFQGNDLRAVRVAEAKGNIDGTECGGLVFRPRHAIRAIAHPGRRCAVFPQDQLGHSVGVRRQDRKAVFSEPATRQSAQRLLVARVGAGARLLRRAGGRHDRAEVRTGVRSPGDEQAGRRVRRVAGARG